MLNVPLLDLCEIKCHLAICKGLLVQVASIPSDKCGHVVSLGGNEKHTNVIITEILRKI